MSRLWRSWPRSNFALVGRGLSFLRWNRASYLLLSLFAATILLIMYVWQPLVKDYLASADPGYPLWQQLDYLLVGVFVAMSLLIMAGPDLRGDLRIVLIGLAGGLVIESWGTQTNLWTYYTLERPPLWIIPAWPVASLAIDRLYRLLRRVVSAAGETEPRRATAGWCYWLTFGAFYALMLGFVWPTLDKSLTQAALLLCALLIISPGDRRGALLTFAAGTGLGYFLELWGTTRACWTYYTQATPPLFAVLGNFARVFSVVLFARYLDPKTATGLYHDYSGLVFFPVAVIAMVGFGNVLNRDWRETFARWFAARSASAAGPAPVAVPKKPKQKKPLRYDY